MAGERLAKALPEYRERYAAADRKERTKSLDEFTGAAGYHRKFAMVLLKRPEENVMDLTAIDERRNLILE